MSARNTPPEATTALHDVDRHLATVPLAFMAEHYAPLAQQAAQKTWSSVDYLTRLAEGEVHLRQDRATQSRIRLARFPVIKTLEQFRWDWPTQMNRLQVQQHFHLEFIKEHANLLFLGGVGLGKPQPGNYPSRLQCITGRHHHRPGSPSPSVWSNVQLGRHDAACASGSLLRGVAAAP